MPNDKGQAERWSVEMNSPNNLTRQGWKSTYLKAGDKVTVTLNPLRDGKNGGLFVAIVLRRRQSDQGSDQPPAAHAGGSRAEELTARQRRRPRP